MSAFEAVRRILAALFALAGLYLVAVNLFILGASLAGHRMPSYAPLIGSVAAMVALLAAPVEVPPWVWAPVAVLLFASESAGSVRNRAVVLIDAQERGWRAALAWKFARDMALFIAALAGVIALMVTAKG